MITKVKKNAQKVRTAYTKPSHIEDIVQFRKYQTPLSSYDFNCRSNSRENTLYLKKRFEEMSRALGGFF